MTHGRTIAAGDLAATGRHHLRTDLSAGHLSLFWRSLAAGAGDRRDAPLQGRRHAGRLAGLPRARRGYRVTIYTFNLRVFDPTWFGTTAAADNPPTQPSPSGAAPTAANRSRRAIQAQHLIERLQTQMAAKDSQKLHAASQAYIEFLTLGGEIDMADLRGNLIRRYLKRSIPVLTGLSATYLYGSPREFGPDCTPDDVRGLPVGHFVVLCGYDKLQQKARLADPYLANPVAMEHFYEVGFDRLVCAILLGVLTYDANLMVVHPRTDGSRGEAVYPKSG